jgi:hypothetical protein
MRSASHEHAPSDSTSKAKNKIKNQAFELEKIMSNSSASLSVRKDSFFRLDDFERNDENVITDSRYDCESYDKHLMSRLLASKDQTAVFEIFAQMWREVKFCDLIFVVLGKQYPAHRLVVGFYSPKYKYLKNTEFK